MGRRGKRGNGGRQEGRSFYFMPIWLIIFCGWPVQSNNPTKLKSNTHTKHTLTWTYIHIDTHTHAAHTLTHNTLTHTHTYTPCACHDLHIELYEATLIAKSRPGSPLGGRGVGKWARAAIKMRALPKAPSNRAENAPLSKSPSPQSLRVPKRAREREREEGEESREGGRGGTMRWLAEC